MVNLKGRDFLKLLDFTSEEIEYLVDLAADLKAKRKRESHTGSTRVRMLLLSLKRQAQERVAALRSVLTISAWAQPILPKVRR